MRVNNPEKFETSIAEHTNPKTGSVITIVGMIHFAEEEYYRKIQQELDERDNAGQSIHYELIREGRATNLGVIGKRKLSLVRAGATAVYGAFQELGLLSQKDSIDYRDQWENNDMSMEEYLSKIKLASALKTCIGGKVFKKLIGVFPHNERVELLSSILEKFEETDIKKRLALTGEISESADVVNAYSGLYEDPLTLTARNVIALEGVDRTLSADPEADIVLMWGQAHILGQSEGLYERGYVQTDEQKVTAITYDSLMR